MTAATTPPLTLAPLNPDVTPSDRMGLTLFLAIIVHAIIILGITFSPELFKQSASKQPPLEITLVHQRSEEAPEEAEFLAQANLLGDGNSEQKNRPTSPATTMITTQSKGAASAATQETAPASPKQPDQKKILTSEQSQQKTGPQDKPDKTHKKSAKSAELIRLNMEIANLSAEIDETMQAFSKQQRHRYISASTREFRDAAYLDSWRTKIERIGNLNYPEAAKRRNLSGSLILDVAINANGSINSITISSSSGHKILDDAAVRIVRLASPFSPFPDDLRKDTDILHIIRGWQFLDSNRLQTSR